MTRPSLFTKLSKLLGVRVEVIRAYVGLLRRKVTVSARRVRQRGPAVGRNIERQNDLYRQWRYAPDDDKPAIAKDLFNEVRHHAQNMVWRRIPEQGKSSLAHDIASVVIEKLGEFRGVGEGGKEAKFTTWVHQIVLNMNNLELRKRSTTREKFVEYDEDNPEVALVATGIPKGVRNVYDDVEERILLDRLRREVSAKEYSLLECMIEGMSTADIAGKLGISEDAAESRGRRLVKKLQEKLSKPRRKVTSASN